jgi:hypothetical protein
LRVCDYRPGFGFVPRTPRILTLQFADRVAPADESRSGAADAEERVAQEAAHLNR